MRRGPPMLLSEKRLTDHLRHDIIIRITVRIMHKVMFRRIKRIQSKALRRDNATLVRNAPLSYTK
jgi:hypothetical protein